MSLPIGFPLYPSSNSKMFNTSLALPGPMLYDIPSVGNFIKTLGYPNSKVSLLFPDIDYISKFASYEIGIADFMLKSSLNENLPKIPTDSTEVKDHFDKMFSSNTQDGMGLKALEKSILSSMFESQKPYFEIAQFIVKSISIIEDTIARIAPLIGAGIVGPDQALSIKSRKPVGNGPTNQNDPQGMGAFGTPVAIGYNGGDEINSDMNDFKTLSKKGNSVSVKRNGEATISKSPTISHESAIYGFVTVSTVYSTGEFDPNADYKYKYVDLDADPEEQPDLAQEEVPDPDTRPSKIILGIFDSNGSPIDPRDKIKYWDIDTNGNLVKANSIFEKASWIYQTEKWIFDKSIGVSQSHWRILNPELYHWKKWGEMKIQSESPGDGWEKMKYKDIIDFDKEENKIYKFKEDDFIVTFSQNTISEYMQYYDESSESEVSKHELDPEDKQELRSQLKKVYNPESILEQLQSLTTLGKLKLSYYSGTEPEDWNRFQFGKNKIPPPQGTYSQFNPFLRKSFKPMKFNIGGKDIWIDPETDYDYKIIRVDSSPRIQYKNSAGINPDSDVILDSQIKEFIKNKLSIVVSDLIGSQISNREFSIEVYKNGALFEIFNNILEYTLTNWNFQSEGISFIKSDENDYRVVIFLPGSNPPEYILNQISSQGSRELVSISTNGPSTYTFPRPDYENTQGSEKEKWEVVSSTSTGSEIISNKIVKSGNEYYYNDSVYKYFLDIRNNPEIIAQAEVLESLGGTENLIQANSLRDQAKEEFKRYEIEGMSRTGTILLSPTSISQFREIKIEIENNRILRWIIYDQIITNVSTFKDSNILPGFFKLNQMNFNLLSTSINSFDKSGNLDTLVITDLNKFQAKLNDKDNKVINSSDITNKRLITNDLYSRGRYGLGYRGGSDPDNPISVGYLVRNQLTELDVETYYIIEAVKEQDNTDPQSSSQSGSSSSGGGFYMIPHALGIVPSTVKMVSSIFSKLIPAIKKLINLIKDPSSFLTEIVKLKAEEHFTIFKPESAQILSELPQLSSSVKSLSGQGKIDALSKMRDQVKNSELGNFIYVDDEGGYKFLLDGSGLIGFFGLMFGLKLDLTNNNPPIQPIFEKSSNNVDFFIKAFKIDKVDTGGIINGVFSSKENMDNYTFNDDPDITTINEEVSIQYSTGKFIEGVDYKYIYVNQYISDILTSANEEESKGSLEDLEKAVGKYEEAYDLVNKSDPMNIPLKREILNKIKNVKDKHNIVSQPILKFILGIVSLPIKIIFEIIQWLVDFFKKLTNPIEIPSLIKEFLSFEWIMKFFTPKGILELAGIKFNPEKVAQWANLANSKKPGSDEFVLGDDYPLADLNQFLSISFQATLPIYTAGQYRDLCLKPFRQFSPLLCLLERIINGFIMLIWSIMGITAIIPPPLIRLCNKINENINIVDFNNILSGVFKDIKEGGKSSQDGSGDTYSFIYEVKLPDGKIERNLDRESIQKFINDNANLNFDFLNFETIE